MNDKLNPNNQTEVPSSQTAVPSSQTAVPSSQTAVPSSQTAVPNSKTVAAGSTQVQKAASTSESIPEYPSYNICGVDYQFVSVISKSSGEANVFHVRNNDKDYALKIYKKHRHPNHTVLETIKNLQGSGLLVDIYEHGIWKDNDGNEFDFELMAYCYGRPLSSIKINNDEKKFREIVVKMGAAIDFLHKHNILHRDIKPSNFIYTDKAETNLVLTDFGIGKMLDKDNRTTTDEGRTPIYAAPEMYTYIPGKPTYVAPASDFYSMGITLLAMCIGEGMLTADEEKLVRNKQEETLPYPTSKFSAHSVSLIKGLTRRNPDNRLGMADIVRWAKGETVYTDNTDAVRSDFRVVFSAKDNIIAHSHEELAKILWEHQDLAKQYLYKDQVEKWFRDMEQPEYALQINSITEEKHPGNMDAGLYATCLLLDPDTPYWGLKGKRIESFEEIADELINNVGTYASALKKGDHNLWLYLAHCDKEAFAQKYCSIIKSRGERGVYEFCYDLNPKLPYHLRAKNGASALVINDFDKLFKYIKDGAISSANIDELDSHDFITWVTKRDSGFGSAISTNLTKNTDLSTENRGWLIAYTLGRNVGYDFVAGKSTLTTIDDIAREIAREVNGSLSNRPLSTQLRASNFKQTRLYQYLYTRGKYQKHIEWIEYCMDLDSHDNTIKYAPYNVRIAQMKCVAGLINEGFPLEIAGVTIRNIKEYEANKSKIDGAIANDASKTQLLQDWLTLSFQEDTKCDYSKTPYLSKVKEYLDYIVKQCFPMSSAAKSATETRREIESAQYNFETVRKRVKRIQLFSIIFCFLPLIATAIYGIIGIYQLDSEVYESLMEVVGEYLGYIVGALCGLVGLGAGLIGAAICAVLGYGITKFICSLLAYVIPWLLIAIVVAIVWFFARKIFVKSASKPTDTWGKMDLEKAKLLACIGDAFNSREKLLPGLPGDYPACVYVQSRNTIKSQIKSIRRNAIFMFIITLLACTGIFWTQISSKYIDVSTQYETSITDKMVGEYSGVFDTVTSTISLEKITADDGVDCLVGTVTINYKKPLVHNIMCRLENEDMDYYRFHTFDQNGTIDQKITYDIVMSYSESFNVMLSGDYANDHKGSRYSFTYNKK